MVLVRSRPGRLGHFCSDVVAVVGHLVVEFSGCGVHSVEPVEAPFDLVNDVGDVVCSGPSVGVIVVAESVWVALVGEHELVDGVCGG